MIFYHELAVAFGAKKRENLFFCVDESFADVSPQRVREGVPWRTTRGTASAQFAREFNFSRSKFEQRKLKSAAEDLLTELRRGRHASGPP